MKSLIIVFGTFLLLVALPYAFQAVDDAITESYTQSISGVTTGAGEYTENITLSRSIYNNDTTSITSISSNITSDSPTAAGYNTVSRQLEVSGLDASQTRTLAVNFLIESTVIPAGSVMFLTLYRWFLVFMIIGMAGGAIYAFFD